MERREFMFNTFEEAMNVHKQMFDIRNQKGYVTCSDMRTLSNPKRVYRTKLNENRGWTVLYNSKIEQGRGRFNDKWILKMPRIRNIKNVKKEND